jgi:hypothetical protein
MEAASGHGKVVRIHVNPAQEAQWRRRAFEEAKERLDLTHVDEDIATPLAEETGPA